MREGERIQLIDKKEETENQLYDSLELFWTFSSYIYDFRFIYFIYKNGHGLYELEVLV